MSLRFCYLTLLAVVVACETGCAWGAWPCGKTWCGDDCGEFYWHEWFSHPPECCDPCDCCGNFTGRPDQSPYTSAYGQFGGGMIPMGMESEGGQVYADPMEPTPAEELPPGEPNAASSMNEFGDLVSAEPPVASSNGSRKLGNLRRATYNAR